MLAGPGLVGTNRDRRTGHGDQQQDGCDLEFHGSSLACFCLVEANQSFLRSISEVLDVVLLVKASV